MLFQRYSNDKRTRPAAYLTLCSKGKHEDLEAVILSPNVPGLCVGGETVIDYVIFKKDMYCEGELHFKAGKKYGIIGEIEGKYAVSYGRKNEMECCLVPKDFEGIEVFS